MDNQVDASVSQYSISDIYQKIKASTLIPQPEFQRKFVWNRSHKEKFIETILKGYPFPEIYIAQKGIDLETIIDQQVVVDGQQRLSTIIQYIDGSGDFGKEVKKYIDLTEKEKRDFLSYKVVFRSLGDIDKTTIIEIFKRINLTQYSLEQVEIRNAIYDGEYITTAKEISEKINLSDFPAFTESRILRMADLDFVLLLMSTIENGGYFNRDSKVEEFITAYNDSYEKSETIKGRLISIVNDFKKLELDVDSIWYRKSNLFTLIVELYTHNDSIEPSKIKEKLIYFEKQILENKNAKTDENDFSTYYSYMYTGTTNRQARVIRGTLFKKYVLN